MQTICGWDKTGHVLVLDAERSCHPWFVLAHEWEDDTELCETIFAQKSVRRDDSSAHGVFPGDINRTPVARLCYQDPSDDNGFTPFVLRFCKDFCFGLASTGGKKANRKNAIDRGPDLAHIMSWWVDSGNGQEVCYSADGSEYMRYDPKTRVYTYPLATCINTVENVRASIQSFYKEEVSVSARLQQTGLKKKASW